MKRASLDGGPLFALFRIAKGKGFLSFAKEYLEDPDLPPLFVPEIK